MAHRDGIFQNQRLGDQLRSGSHLEVEYGLVGVLLNRWDVSRPLKHGIAPPSAQEYPNSMPWCQKLVRMVARCQRSEL